MPNHKPKKIGRPTKYHPRLLKRVIELMREGKSKEQVAARIGITVDTMNRWEHKNPIFSEAMKKGVELSRAWWMDHGQDNLKDRTFNYVGWYMNMKNRFGWADKQEVKHSGIQPNLTVIATGDYKPKRPTNRITHVEKGGDSE